MDYTLNSVKYLYDNYSIKKSERGEYIIVNRSNGQFVFGSDLEPNVKFAHTWFLARQEGRSRTTPVTGITEEEYSRAFDEQANELYDYIMATSIQAVEAGSFLKSEALAKDVSEALPLPYVKETAIGLYENENRRLSFKQWVRKATLEKRNSQQTRISR